MVSNFFINILLLISVIFMAGHLSKDRPVCKELKLKCKMVIGIIGGLLGIGMVIYTITITGTKIIIDLRVMPFMITYYIGGLLPAVITGIITLLFRIFYYGMSNSAVIGIMQFVILIPIYYFISGFRLCNKNRWRTMVIATMAVLISTVYYLLYNVENGLGILFIYSVFYIIAFTVAYNVLKYVKSANELYRRYKDEAAKDFLTGLNNTRQFDITFNRRIHEAVEKRESISCLMIDIDHFKKVNDTYGHAVGDLALKELSSIIGSTCRQSDDVSRVGGEEFCALLENCTFSQAEVIANRICEKVRSNKFNIGNSYINITVSIGISSYPENVSSTDELLEQADQALYKAKRTGRDRVCSPAN